MRQRFDLARERRGKHQRLALVRQGFHDLPDRREETHVEHPVRFIEHEKINPGKIRVALAHQVNQTTRRRHHQLDARAQRLDLRPFAHAAEDRGHAQRQMFRVSAHIFLDLHHQFPRRRDDQRLHAALLPFGHASREMMQDGQNKRRGFARSRLRDADDIVAREHFGDGGRLNGSRFGVTSFLDGFENAVVET